MNATQTRFLIYFVICLALAIVLASIASCRQDNKDGNETFDSGDANREHEVELVPLVGHSGTYQEPEYALFPLLRRLDILYQGQLDAIRVDWHPDEIVYDHTGRPIIRIDQNWWNLLIENERRRSGDATRSGGDFAHTQYDGHENVPQFLYTRQVDDDGSLILRTVGKHTPPVN